MTVLLYLGKVVACSGLLYGYYFFFLRNKQFNQYNRFYLLAGPVLSLLFPLLSIGFLQAAGQQNDTLLKTLQVISVREWENELLSGTNHDGPSPLFTLQNCLLTLYLSGIFVSGYLFARSLMHIRKLSRKYNSQAFERICFFSTREPGTPFSFFRFIFWNADIEPGSGEGQRILQHELYHIRAGHSYDTVFMRCVTMLFWFNPFYHLYLTELKAVHEFQADEHASSADNKWDYAELLVTQAIAKKQSLLYNPFFHNQIKRRIHMIIQQNQSKFITTRKFMALPLLFMLFCAFGIKNAHQYRAGTPFVSKASGQITVIIDAAHGGPDAGASSNSGLSEKDFSLSIARKIKKLSTQYGIDVIMTRDDDMLPGNAANPQDGLKNRLSILEKSKADLFVSIHLNAADPKNTAKQGFEIYVSSKNKQYEKSKLLGSAILGEIKTIYPTAGVLKERDPIYLLTNSTAPSVLLECGYMTNDADMAFITDEKNQENLAHNILKGIVQYQKNVGTTNP